MQGFGGLTGEGAAVCCKAGGVLASVEVSQENAIHDPALRGLCENGREHYSIGAVSIALLPRLRHLSLAPTGPLRNTVQEGMEPQTEPCWFERDGYEE